MSHLYRSAFATLVLAAIAAPGVRAADSTSAQGRGTIASYTATPRGGPGTDALLAPSVQLEGIWMFDAAHSDDAMKVMQASRPQGGPGGEGGPRMGGGMGGGRRGGGGGEGGGWGGRGGGMRPGGDDSADGDHPDQPAENRPRGPSPMARLMRPAAKVVIEMQADQVNVTEDDHSPRPYALSDSLKAHHHELLTENTSARWKDGGVEMTQTLGQRGKLVETYTLSHDGKTLTIRARREGGREGMPNPVITRVYTRYDGE